MVKAIPVLVSHLKVWLVERSSKQIAIFVLMADNEETPMIEYSDHPDDPNYVLVKAEIPQLQKVRCCMKRENAYIDFHATDSSFLLVVKMHDGSKVYRLDIKRLPKQILEDPLKTFYKTNGDTIEIHLHKKVSEPWSQFLSSVGLDHSGENA